MTKNKDPNQESLAEIAIDPDVLARELALDIEIDPLEQIDEDVFSKDLNITKECEEALKMRSRGSISISKANSLAKTSGSTAMSAKLSLLGSLFFVIFRI